MRRSYRSHRSHSTHHSSHSHHTSSHGHHNTYTRGSTQTRRSQDRATIEPYLTGGLGISGFASAAIVDGPALPGIGYNLALGAKGKLFGAELGVNGGGYTFTPGSASVDMALVGLSGDFKLQPSIAFFEPYVSLGIGGYALQDAVIDETSTGVGLRVGAGADFRFDDFALRVSYLYGGYGLGNDHAAYGGDGDFGAKTETLGAALIVYF